jgi:hypothetical protein
MNENMNELENAGIKHWSHHCIVCRKTVDQGEGMAHIRVGDEMIAICCPLCFETFNKNPKHYLMLREIHRDEVKLRGGTAPTQ